MVLKTLFYPRQLSRPGKVIITMIKGTKRNFSMPNKLCILERERENQDKTNKTKRVGRCATFYSRDGFSSCTDGC